METHLATAQQEAVAHEFYLFWRERKGMMPEITQSQKELILQLMNTGQTAETAFASILKK